MLTEKVASDALAKLQLVETLQRLGVSYYFQEEIEAILKAVHQNDPGNKETWKKNNLSSITLEFRLLRQHGFWVPQGKLFVWYLLNK